MYKQISIKIKKIYVINYLKKEQNNVIDFIDYLKKLRDKC